MPDNFGVGVKLPSEQSGHGKLSLTVAKICGRESGRFTVLLGDDGYVLLSTVGRNNRCISY